MPPPGYAVDHTRIRLGEGEAVFSAAKAALGRWEQFNLGWMQAWSPDDSIKVGGLVGVAARSFGMWWLNACRVVYVVDEQNGSMFEPGWTERGADAIAGPDNAFIPRVADAGKIFGNQQVM